MPEVTVSLAPIKDVPPYATPLVTALGLAYLNWGRMEQHLELLLQHANEPRFVTGQVAKFPDTSFRLKSALFKKIYAEHPAFKRVHSLAAGVCVGLKKANVSRVRMVHSNFQEFAPGPPSAMEVTILKFKGRDLHPFHGTWTLEAIEHFNELLCRLSDDMGKISALTMNDAFRQSLEKELSRIQRAKLWARHLLSRLPRLCSRRVDFLA
jgi:hypothetical protein